MTLNRVKLERAVTLMRYRANIVSLIFLQKTLNWNKITFLVSNWRNIAELVVNELMKSIPKQNYQYSFFYTIYHWLIKKFQELITKELDNFTKVLIRIVFYQT